MGGVAMGARPGGASAFPMPPSLSPFSGDFDFDEEFEMLGADTTKEMYKMPSEDNVVVPEIPAFPFALACTHVELPRESHSASLLKRRVESVLRRSGAHVTEFNEAKLRWKAVLYIRNEAISFRASMFRTGGKKRGKAGARPECYAVEFQRRSGGGLCFHKFWERARAILAAKVEVAQHEDEPIEVEVFSPAAAGSGSLTSASASQCAIAAEEVATILAVASPGSAEQKEGLLSLANATAAGLCCTQREANGMAPAVAAAVAAAAVAAMNAALPLLRTRAAEAPALADEPYARAEALRNAAAAIANACGACALALAAGGGSGSERAEANRAEALKIASAAVGPVVRLMKSAAETADELAAAAAPVGGGGGAGEDSDRTSGDWSSDDDDILGAMGIKSASSSVASSCLRTERCACAAQARRSCAAALAALALAARPSDFKSYGAVASLRRCCRGSSKGDFHLQRHAELALGRLEAAQV